MSTYEIGKKSGNKEKDVCLLLNFEIIQIGFT